MIPDLTLFVADILPSATPEEWGMSTKVLIVAIALLYIGTSIWNNLRRQPSIETEVDHKIAEATASLEKRIETKLADLKDQLQKQGDRTDRIQVSIESGFRDIQRSIGRLEGKIETHSES